MTAPTLAPVLTLGYGTDFSGPATVIAFDAATRVQHAFSGTDADAFPSPPLTVSMWIKTLDAGNSTLVEYAGTRAGSPVFAIRQPNNLTISLAGTDWVTGVSIADGQWRHVCVILTMGRWGLVNATLQLDSLDVAAGSGVFTLSADNPIDPAGELTLAGTAAAAQLTASVSEFRLWRCALLPGQRLADLQRRVASPQADLVLVRALSDDASSETLVGTADPFTVSTLSFRVPKVGAPGYAQASWTTVAGATGYELQIASGNSGWVDLAPTTAATQASLAGLPLGSGCQGRVRACNASGAGPWSTLASLTPIDLPQPVTALAWKSSNAEIWADWEPTGQAASYWVELARTPALSPPADPVETTETTLNVSTILADSNGWQVLVEGAVLGSLGPANIAGPVEAPPASMFYINSGTNGQFEFDWPAGTSSPLSGQFTVKRDATVLVDTVVQAPASPQNFDSAQPVTAGEAVTGTTRFVYPAALTGVTTQAVTVDDIPAPVPTFQIAPSIAAESVAWVWGSVTQTPLFNVALLRDAVEIDSLPNTALRTLSLDSYLPATAAELYPYTIQVQGVQGSTVGPPNSVTPGETTTGALVYRWAGGTDPGSLALEWSPGTAAGQQIYARIFQTGQPAIFYHAAADILAKTLTVPAPAAGFAAGDAYTATLSVLASGSFTGAFASSATVHNLAAPTLTLLADSVAMTLFASWTAPAGVPAGTSYAVLLDGVVTGPAQAGLNYNLTSHLGDAAASTVQVEATFENAYSAASAAGTAPSAMPALSYQAAAAGGVLTAAWQPAAINYVELTGPTPTVIELYSDGTDQYTVNNPAAGTSFALRVKSIANNQLGDFESATAVVIHDLAAPVLSFEQATGADVTAVWTAVDAGGPAVNYQLRLDGTAAGAPVAATRELLVGVLDRNPTASETVDVQAISEGSHGLWSAVATILAPASLTLTYDPATLIAAVSWPASSGAGHYAVCIADGAGTALGRAWVDVPGSSPPAIYSANITLTALTEGQVVQASVRALAAGLITAEVTQSLTMRVFPAPGLSSAGVVDDPSADQLSVSWSFVPATYGLTSANTVYNVEVTDAGGVVQGSANGVSGLTATVGYPAGTPDGSTLYVRVRAIGAGVIGAWTAAVGVVVGSVLGQPTVTSFSFDAQNAMTISWQAVDPPAPGDTVTYSVNVTGPGLKPIFPNSTTQTSLTLSAATTGVQEHTSYTAIVTATQPAPAGPASAPRTSISNTLEPSSPGTGNGGHGGDPFSLANGAYMYSHADLVVAGTVPLRLTVYYNSMLGWPAEHPAFADQPLGPRWDHTFNTRIYIPANQGADPYVMLVWGHGALITYDFPTAVGQLTQRDRPTGDVLVLNADGSYTLTRLDQTRYVFDAAGKLSRIEDRYGNPARLSYNPAGRLDRVTDQASARFIQFNYVSPESATSLLASVADNAGRVVTYTFSSGVLATSTGPGPGPRRFTYTGDALMQTAGDENQHTIVDNTYDPTTHRIINQRPPNAIAAGANWSYQIAWAEGTDPQGHATEIATLTDPEGNVSVTTSLSVTGDSVEEVTTLTATTVLRRTRAFDGAGRQLYETIFEGASGAAATAGATTSYGYDGRGRPTLIDPPGLGQLALSYDALGNMLTSVDLLGNVTRYSYNPDNTLASHSMPGGTRIEYSYEAGAIHGLVRRIDTLPGTGNGSTSNAANSETRTYYGNGQLKSVTSATGGVIQYAYAPDTGWLTSRTVTNPDGSVLLSESFVRDPATGRVSSARRCYDGQPDAQAFVVGYEYDNVGNLKTLTGPAGSVWRYEYDAANNQTQVTYPPLDGRSDVTVYVYDRNNRLTETITQAADPRIARSVGYDPAGRVTSRTDPMGNETGFVYSQVDRDGVAVNRTVTTYPPASAGATPVFELQEIDPLGRLLAWSLPAEQGSDPVTVTQSFALAPAPLPDTTIGLQCTRLTPPGDAGGAATTQVWIVDASGRTITYTNEDEKVWNWAWTSSQPVAGGPVNVTATLTDPEQIQRADVYDPVGLPVAIRLGPDGSSHDFGFQFDALARLRQAIDPITADPPAGGGAPGLATTHYDFSFDLASARSVLSVAAYGASPSQYFYDGENRLTGYRDPNGVAGAYTYGRGELMTSWTNGRGETTVYGFDPAGRLVSSTYPDGSVVEQILDANGHRLVTRVDGNDAITRVFDDLNRMLSRESGGLTVGYTYTPSGSEHVLTYPGATKTVTYGYDALDRLKTVTDWAARQTVYSYNLAGRLETELRPDGVVITNGYDAAGRLLSVAAVANGDEVIASTVYTYDPYTNRQSVNQIAPVPPASIPADSDFTYLADRLTQAGLDHVTYDDDGNMLGWGVGGLGQIQYDSLNRVSALGASRFVYDADGLRTGIVTGADTQSFVLDIADYRSPRVEMASPLSAIRRVVQTQSNPAMVVPSASASLARPGGVRSPLDRVLSATTAAGTDFYIHGLGLIGRETSAGSYQDYVFDPLGSTLALVAAGGAVQGGRIYAPYGQTLGAHGNSPAPFGYAGRFGVMEDGDDWCFMRAREYGLGINRFTARDVVYGDSMLPQTLNRYAYLVGQPLLLIDPTGLGGDHDGGGGGGWGVFGAVVGGVIGVGLIGGAIIAGLGAGGAGAGGAAGAGGLGAAGVGGGLAETDALLGEFGSEFGDVELEDLGSELGGEEFTADYVSAEDFFGGRSAGGSGESGGSSGLRNRFPGRQGSIGRGEVSDVNPAGKSKWT